jgi:hypothetical protein
MDFLWHKVSEKEKQEIQAQAKEIMNRFSNNLSKIKDKLEESSVERDFGERAEEETSSKLGQSKGEEKEKNKDNEFSKDIMFKNAKEKNKDFIIAEKKTW